ncbi:FAD/NAD(P)-binding domain-containing protein [Dendrothele bispora CBS 962.96]|uniref:FAD/NAD(P)-binding domain-containing protein n=1 Tax=Dendrothele bispora (strain CBS 962.96) TaxID=1314807 RepID=A0A4S8L8U2_DENBC|nr:FAD/NAD(P)-binding domain-containing protein [Dendrothele bispora CBS 962.96]
MPGHIINTQKAQVPLRILVVGGSIGGLASAYTLQRAGHDVIVLEQGDGKERSLGGLRSPPNMTRVLTRWGLAPYLSKFAQKCTQFSFMQGETGEQIGLMKLHEELLRDLLADFMFIQHGDLLSILLDLALREGVELRYNSKAVTIATNPPSLTLDNGETLYADLIVGADGQRSFIRDVILSKPLEEEPADQMCLTFSIPTELMQADDDLRHLTEISDWSIWLGDSYLFHGSLVSGQRRYSILLSFSVDEDLSEYLENWTNHYSLDHFNLDLDRFDPRVAKLLQMAEYVTPTSYMKRPALDTLVDDHAKIVLVGEAAHPLMPGGVHPTAMCLEDAEVLGNLFSRLHHAEDIPRLLAGYEEIRLQRLHASQRWEYRKRLMLTLPKGPEQQKRDDKIRWGTEYEHWDHMNETSFREIWGDEIDFYVYDATEKAEDWYIKWGRLMSQQTNRVDITVPPTPTVEVSISAH